MRGCRRLILLSEEASILTLWHYCLWIILNPFDLPALPDPFISRMPDLPEPSVWLYFVQGHSCLDYYSNLVQVFLSHQTCLFFAFQSFEGQQLLEWTATNDQRSHSQLARRLTSMVIFQAYSTNQHLLRWSLVSVHYCPAAWRTQSSSESSKWIGALIATVSQPRASYWYHYLELRTQADWFVTSWLMAHKWAGFRVAEPCRYWLSWNQYDRI